MEILDWIIFDIKNFSPVVFRIYKDFFIDYFHELFLNKPKLSTEAFFWRRNYNKWYINNPRWLNELIKKPKKDNVMSIIIKELEKSFKEKLRFLDVGSGPVISYLEFMDIREKNLVNIDPLADIYNELNNQFKNIYPIKILKGTGENLDKIFPSDTFHMTLSKNSIDHSIDPKKFFKNMVNTTKYDGYIWLSGNINEGKRNKYMGLHKHNIQIIKNLPYYSSKDEVYKPLIENLPIKLQYYDYNKEKSRDKYNLIYKKFK
jgi:ubiquinone/menaquinone biosynthesis C-methylase UbiE